MKKLITLGSTLLALSIAQLASAVPISGEIHINSFGSTATVDTTANTVTFAPAAGANNGIVAFANGSYAGLLGTMASYANFSYSPLSVTAVGGWVAGTIWRLDVDTYFVLNTITSISETGGLVLHGTGSAFHNAFDPTQGVWSFSADSTGSAFAYSSTTQVPDGGTTVALLGLALGGLAVLRRKLSA